MHILAGLLICAGAMLPASEGSSADCPFEVRPTQLLRSTEQGRATVVHLVAGRDMSGRMRVVVRTADGRELENRWLDAVQTGSSFAIPVPTPAGIAAVDIEIAVEVPGHAATVCHARVPAADDDWVMHFIPGFHYDPVWWNTQAHYTETGYKMGNSVGPGLTLVGEYLRKCFEDKDYTVALHQLPYLKTFIEAHPQAVPDLRARIDEGRCAIVGGTYNELSTTLISAEATARNAVYGTLFQTQVLGGDGRIWWQCDVFGHDPSFPSLMRAAGHTAGAFARGPFHQWGAPREHVNFPSEFMWMAPDGSSVLTHYMTGHYGYAYAELSAGTNSAPQDPRRSAEIIARMFEDLRRPALTHHVLLPMHMDFIRPMENLGPVVRAWNAEYISPQALMSTPAVFFGAVRASIDRGGRIPPVITRDMNPIYTGCPVSYADLKTANRACEVMLRDAEIFATLATLEGAPYPAWALDRAWRQLLFNAHHDAVTGSMSDQVYLDVMYIYRDCLDIARAVRDWALEYLNTHVVAPSNAETVLWSTLATARRVSVDGAPRETRLDGVGYVRQPRVDDPTLGTTPAELTLENDTLRVTIDPQRGGTIKSLVDVVDNRELLRGPGNDVIVLDEYDSLPGHGEGPWHLAPTGASYSGAAQGLVAECVPDDDAPSTLRCRVPYPEFTLETRYTLVPQTPRLDMETRILDWRGSNKLLRAAFPLNMPGARPVFQTAAAVIGRPFGREVDAAKDAWSLDQSSWQWAGLGTVCTAEIRMGDTTRHRRALAVGEIVVPDDATNDVVEDAGRLAWAFVRSGVTTTTTRADQRRYGDLEFDSNTPDFRVSLGASKVQLQRLGVRQTVDLKQASWVERPDELPLLILPTTETIDQVIASLTRHHAVRVDAAHARIATPHVVEDRTVALVNRGSVSVHTSEDGLLGLNLMRSCTGWPAGIWIDEPRRALPDGDVLQTMHGSHIFRYSLVVARNGFREGHINRIAQEVNHPVLRSASSGNGAGAGPSKRSFVRIEHPDVRLAALKPAGFTEAEWSTVDGSTPSTRVVMRLWNGAGEPVTTTVHLDHFAGKAWLSDLLEQPQHPLPIDDKRFEVSLAPNAYATVLCDVQASARMRPEAALPLDEWRLAPSAYWLENLGEGVLGNGLLAIAPARREVRLGEERVTIPVRVVNNHRAAPVKVALEVDAPDTLEVSLSQTELEIPAAGFLEIDLALQSHSAVVARALVTITAETPYAWDASASVWIEPAHPVVGPLIEIDTPAPLTALSGPRLRARIRNNTASPIRGEAAWISPMVLWDDTPLWREVITVPAHGEIDCVQALEGGFDSYAILRFTAGGRVFYGPAVAVVEDPNRVLIVPDVERVRLRGTDPGTVSIVARSLSGLNADSAITINEPQGWQVREVSRQWAANGGTSEVVVAFELRSSGQLGAVELPIIGPHGSRSRLHASVVPLQRARSTATAVVIDGDLDEWSAEEFSQVSSDLGDIRCAVRYDPAGLVLAFDVTDQNFVQRHAGASMWNGDSIQFGLSVEPSTAAGYQDTDYEYGAALTPDGPMVWCWIAGTAARTGLIDTATVAVDVAADHTRYEIRLPDTTLPLPPLTPGTVMGFTYIANDNDGQGFQGAVQWTAGISGGKDPSQFGDLLLE